MQAHPSRTANPCQQCRFRTLAEVSSFVPRCLEGPEVTLWLCHSRNGARGTGGFALLEPEALATVPAPSPYSPPLRSPCLSSNCVTSKDWSGQLAPQPRSGVPAQLLRSPTQNTILAFKSSSGRRAGNVEQRSCLEVVPLSQRSEAPAPAAGPGTMPSLTLKTQLCGLQAHIQDDPDSTYSQGEACLLF